MNFKFTLLFYCSFLSYPSVLAQRNQYCISANAYFSSNENGTDTCKYRRWKLYHKMVK